MSQAAPYGGPAPSPLERIPPQHLEAEQAVLGALLVAPDAVGRVAEVLRSDSFYRKAHQHVYDAALALFEKGEPVDLVTVANQLKATDMLDEAGGYGYLMELAGMVATAANVEYYAKIIEDKATLRALIQNAGEAIARAYADDGNVDAVLDEAEKLIMAVGERRNTSALQPIKDILHAAFEKIEKRFENSESVTGISTAFYDLDAMTSGLQPSDMIILAARPSMGKCLTASTVLPLPNGERVTIEECVRRRVSEVYGIGDDGVVRPVAVSDWIDSGVKPAFRVRTRLGREVEVTGHHPFLTVGGWTPLNELAVGSRIAVPRVVPAFGDDDPSPELARLLAYYIAEGGLSQTVPKFTNTDPEIVADFKAAIAKHFPECQVRLLDDGITYAPVRPDWRHRQSTPNPVTAWLRVLGLWGKKADAKAVPEVVWRWNRATSREFLRALMSCDGTIYPMAGKPRIEFTVASERLARDVQHLLTRFGIVAKFWRKTARSWRVEVTEPRSVVIYQEQIGWIGEKATRLVGAAAEGRANVGHVPVECWAYVREGLKAKGLAMVELARQCGETEAVGKFGGYNPHMRRGIPQHRLAAYASILADPRLCRAASPDLFWDEIVAIEPLGEQQVYDLTVPEGSNFIAADVCVHNTALALNIAQNVAIHSHLPTLIFSLEMSAEQLVNRMLCSEASIDAHRLKTGYLAEADWPKLTAAIGRLSDAPIYIDDTPGITAMEVRGKARRLKQETKSELGLIVIDYLQLMTGKGGENRVQEIAQISRSIKGLARELHVPVIALSQLSRAVESRPDKRPMLSDLRESGSIEQDADLVMFIYRDEYYNPESTEKNIAEVIIAKHRNGAVGKVRLFFHKELTRFESLTGYAGAPVG